MVLPQEHPLMLVPDVMLILYLGQPTDIVIKPPPSARVF
jgi:hypothetical protein